MADACPNKAENLAFCTCSYACDKRGVCCECVAYHRKKGQIPGCFFTKEGEATWDRSVQHFCKDHGRSL
jgi:hypothetical protein